MNETNEIFDNSGYVNSTNVMYYVLDFIDENQELYPIIKKEDMDYRSNKYIKIKDIYFNLMNEVYIKQIKSFINVILNHRKKYKKKYSYKYSNTFFKEFLYSFFRLDKIEERNAFGPYKYDLFMINNKSITYINSDTGGRKYIKSVKSLNKTLHQSFSLLNQKYTLLKNNIDQFLFNTENFLDKITIKDDFGRFLPNENKESVIALYSKYYETLIDFILTNPFYKMDYNYYNGYASTGIPPLSINKYYSKSIKLRLIENEDQIDPFDTYNIEEKKILKTVTSLYKNKYYFTRTLEIGIINFENNIKFKNISENGSYDFEIESVNIMIDVPNICHIIKDMEYVQSKFFEKLVHFNNNKLLKIGRKKLKKLSGFVVSYKENQSILKTIFGNYKRQILRENQTEVLNNTINDLFILCNNALYVNDQFMKTIVKDFSENNKRIFSKLIRI